MSAATILILLVAGVSADQALPSRGSKPVRESRVFVDTAQPPDTAAGLARESAAIVVARYDGRRRVIDGSSSGPMRTVYSLEIQEVLKQNPNLPQHEIEVALTGGEREFTDHIVRLNIAGADHLKIGHTYVIFLNLNVVSGELYVAYASSGIYDITSGRVAATKHNRTRDNGKRGDAFLNELRAALNR